MKTKLETTWAEFEANIALAENMPAAAEDHEGHEVWVIFRNELLRRRDRMLELARKFPIKKTPPDWLNQFDNREQAYFNWMLSLI